jgi:hypothetical protein
VTMTDSDAAWDGTGIAAPEWYPLPSPFSKYEVSFDGSGPDQRPVRRIGGKPLSTQPAQHGGYLMVKPYDDSGIRQTVAVHILVLLAATGVPCPDGLESCHLDDDPLNNRWRPGDTDDEVRAAGGNLVRRTKKQNARHKFLNGGQAPTPKAYECVNHARCGGMVANEGSRCLPCVEQVGERAAVMLNAGLPLDEVTRRLDYRNPEWVWKLAVRYGGYAESLPHARSQTPPMSRRVTTTLRAIFRRSLRVGS